MMRRMHKKPFAVGANGSLKGRLQELVEECGEVCEELGLHMPFSIALGAASDHAVLHGGLLGAAHNPAAALAIPLTASLKVRLCPFRPE